MTRDQLQDLDYLIEKSKSVEMSDDQISAQRRSFAFGNSAFENARITREIVDEEARKLGF